MYQSNNIRLHIIFEKFSGFDGQSITQLLYILFNVLPFIEEVVVGLALFFFFFASIFLLSIVPQRCVPYFCTLLPFLCEILLLRSWIPSRNSWLLDALPMLSSAQSATFPSWAKPSETYQRAECSEICKHWGSSLVAEIMTSALSASLPYLSFTL